VNSTSVKMAFEVLYFKPFECGSPPAVGPAKFQQGPFIFMRENILFSIAGVVLGFFIGFFIANSSMNQPPTPSAASDSARSRDETRLPPGHPDISGTGGGNPASTNATAQQAMDEADRNPQNFEAQFRAAVVFFELAAYDKARLYLDRSLALRPEDAAALTGMGQTKYRLGDYAGAATFFEKALTQRPNDPELRTNLGDAYFQQTPPNYDRAIAEYRKALNTDPNHEPALAALADALFRKGDKTAAREVVDKLAAVNPSNNALKTLRSMLNGQ